MSTLIDRAHTFASLAHEAVGQKRKYTGEPYINHPVAVAELVKQVRHTEAMIAAALLHDVVEDTNVTLTDIFDHFGAEVSHLVGCLTDVSRPQDGNRAVRKALDRDHLAKASPEAKTIKLADTIDNGEFIIERDPKFAIVWLTEKEALLPFLVEGDATLWARANRMVMGGLLYLQSIEDSKRKLDAMGAAELEKHFIQYQQLVKSGVQPSI